MTPERAYTNERRTAKRRIRKKWRAVRLKLIRFNQQELVMPTYELLNIEGKKPHGL